MERRHQVFVSSTYKDLEEERKEIIHALLELDCMPAGMELFPATDEDAWSLIQSVIDDSDYYILVIAGRYGSTGPDGLSFTEKEYDYAVESGKPVMAFLHSEPEKIPSGKCDDKAENKAKLVAFRAKVESNNHVKYWTNAPGLGAVVSRGLIQMRRNYPSDGWIPGKYAIDETTLLELEQLRARVKELEAEILISQKNALAKLNSEELAQGEDEKAFISPLRLSNPEEKIEQTFKTTWNKLFSYVGPSLIGECDEETLLSRMKLAFWHAVPKKYRDRSSTSNFVVPHVINDSIKLQLRALGYITPGIKRRAVSDKKTYWALTPVGEEKLMQITAVKRPTKTISADPKTSTIQEKKETASKVKALSVRTRPALKTVKK